ncbi:MAG: dienelactone hydrolase family protein [Planctomycetales bacterium]|nr:dienelactone hydrolase family protein [Planctomycetales bacterium]
MKLNDRFWKSLIRQQFVTMALLVTLTSNVSADAISDLTAFLNSHEISAVAEQDFANVKLSKSDAERAIAVLKKKRLETVRSNSKEELNAGELKLGELRMPIWFKAYGEAPANGHSLFISMHGGGNAPKRVNDRQWENQKQLYEPSEGVYVAPRAPTDTWNLWHQGHIDQFYDRLIEIMVATQNVNPDRVYIMGYSAGGDGVFQLAPRMADRLAAAAMMAGHPNETKPDGLRNIGFALFMGGKDAAYKRNEVAADWKEKLAELRKQDPEGYEHEVTIFPEFGHWMQRKDAVGVPWMAKFKRKNWPMKIVWLQDDVTHDRFYWLQLPENEVKSRQRIVATCDGKDLTVSGEVKSITLLLNDDLVNLDEPIVVTLNGKKQKAASVQRTIGVIAKSVDRYGAARPVPTAMLEVVAD